MISGELHVLAFCEEFADFVRAAQSPGGRDADVISPIAMVDRDVAGRHANLCVA
jgi:hypothetical protein